MLNVGGSLCLDNVVPMNIFTAEMKAGLCTKCTCILLSSDTSNECRYLCGSLAQSISTSTKTFSLVSRCYSFCSLSLTLARFLSVTSALKSIKVMLPVFNTIYPSALLHSSSRLVRRCSESSAGTDLNRRTILMHFIIHHYYYAIISNRQRFV